MVDESPQRKNGQWLRRNPDTKSENKSSRKSRQKPRQKPPERPRPKQRAKPSERQRQKQSRGRDGENAAAAFLESRGYRIVATNVRQGRWEIDLIATDEDLLVFVEVRSRAHAGLGFPSETVDLRKQRHVANAAQLWLQWQRRFWDEIRFDVIEVIGDGSALSCRHFPDAFQSPF